MSNKEKLEIARHSLAHIMAASILKLWPEARFGVGPVINNGFYYDITIPNISLKEQDLKKITKQMKKMIQAKESFTRSEISIDEAINKFSELNQPFKVELLQDLKTKGSTRLDDTEQEVMPTGGSKVSLYQTGEFLDLCRGPHIKDTSELKNIAFTLHKLAGAYWRGNENNEMLTRIYGLAFTNQTELDKYLKLLAEAEKRDHRKLGKELELFMIDEEVGQGLPLWLPNGALLVQEIEKFILAAYQKKGYKLVRTPHIANGKLFAQSGHLGFYKDGMYSPMNIDGEDYYVKPMNCPFHVKIYKSSLHSYRELPIRYTELGTVYRYEKSGTLHGLTRVRGFTQDDAHIICTPEQLTDELVGVITLTKFILNTFGFNKFKVALSVRSKNNKEKYLGTDQDWEIAENGLKKALEISGWNFVEEEGEAVFYGPKIDIKIFDAMNREWQLSTLQLDFNLPERFEMTYTDNNGHKQKPFMLHRALLGSLERFIGVLIEHYGGAFPTWLSPIQVSIISVGENHREYCEKLGQKLKNANIRVEIDSANETVGNKIRKAVKQKIPYMLVIGDKEIASSDLMVRVRGQEDLLKISEADFIAKIKTEIENRTK